MFPRIGADSAEMLAQTIRDGKTEKVDELNGQLDLLVENSAEVQTAITTLGGFLISLFSIDHTLNLH